MGSEKWFNSLLMNPEKIPDILNYSLDFAEIWAKGHLEAGADVIVVVDGVGTATSIPKDIFQEFVIPTYKELNKRLGVPIVFYTAGGDMLPFADLLAQTGVIGVFPSADDDLQEFKEKSQNKYTIFGNINNLEMAEWPEDFMDEIIRDTINIGKPGGKYVFATQHMIPHGVSQEKIAKLITYALNYGFY